MRTEQLQDELARLGLTPAQYRRMRVVPRAAASTAAASPQAAKPGAARAEAEAKAGPPAGAPRGRIRANAPTSTPNPQWKRPEVLALGGLGLTALLAFGAAMIGIATHETPPPAPPRKKPTRT